MTAPITHTHDQNCWRFSERCALERAKVALETHERHKSQVRTRDLLAVVRMALLDHVDKMCPDGHECFALSRARAFLAEP